MSSLQKTPITLNFPSLVEGDCKDLLFCTTAKSPHSAVAKHADARQEAREKPLDRQGVTENGEGERSDMFFQEDQQRPLRIRSRVAAPLAEGTVNTAMQCCMLAQMEMVEEANRKYALSPYSDN